MKMLNLHKISVDDLNKESIKIECKQILLASNFSIRCRNNLILHRNEDSSVSFALPFVSLYIPSRSLMFDWYCPIIRRDLNDTNQIDFKRLLADLLIIEDSNYIGSKFEYYEDENKEKGIIRNAKFEFILKQNEPKYELYENYPYALVEGVDFGQSNNIEFSKDETYLIIEKFKERGYDCSSDYDKSIWHYQDLLECYKVIDGVLEETRA